MAERKRCPTCGDTWTKGDWCPNGCDDHTDDEDDSEE